MSTGPLSIFEGETVSFGRGSTPGRYSLGPIAVSDGTWVSSAIRDISERKRLDESLAPVLAEARSASKAKSDILSNMSHELRTPLVNGFANPTESGDAKKAGMLFAASEPGQGRAQPGEANP